jgi:hypothetical protein
VASGSVARVHKKEPLGRYNLLRISRSDDGRAIIECTTRGLDAGDNAVVQVARRLVT